MNSPKSRDAVLEFLDYLARKGIMNKNTVSARKAAVNVVLGVLEPEEVQDVSQLDLDDVMMRFYTLKGSDFTPGSLNTYKSRLKAAIVDFLAYQENPMTFKPSVQAAGRKSTERASGSRIDKKQTRAQPHHIGGYDRLPEPPTSVSILPIPIRPDLTVRIQGLPYDLTPSEADKIANVVKAMATQK